MIQEMVWKKVSEQIADILEHRYNPEDGLVWAKAMEINYHTAVNSGIVHHTRENISWLPALLKRGEPGDMEIARKSLLQVLALQDTNERHLTYGIWPYLFEETLDRMKNPDWNWAAFLGASLAVLLEELRADFPAELTERMEQALSRACESILRRNMGVDYTNISLMSAGVLVLTGELLSREDYRKRGQEILERQLEFVEYNGGYAEYNSPTYGVLDIEETGRVLHYTRHEETREVAGKLHSLAWKVFAEHYHPATGQLAPPHARCYEDMQDASIRTLISVGTEGACMLEPYESWKVGDQWPFMTLKCPRELWGYFQKQERPRILREDFYKGIDTIEDDQVRVLIEKGTPPLTAYTYFHPAYCLGTFARHDLWNQRRPLMAYFKTEAGNVCFRLRCMHDDMDFAGAVIRTAQQENAAVGTVGFVTDHGDYHYILTPLKDGCMTADRVSLDFLVEGAVEAVQVREVTEEAPGGADRRGPLLGAAESIGNAVESAGYADSRLFAFEMEERTLYLRILGAVFGNEPVRIEFFGENSAEKGVWPMDRGNGGKIAERGVRVILFEGQRRELDFHQLDRAYAAFWLEVVEKGRTAVSSGYLTAEWTGERAAEASAICGCSAKEAAAAGRITVLEKRLLCIRKDADGGGVALPVMERVGTYLPPVDGQRKEFLYGGFLYRQE